MRSWQRCRCRRGCRWPRWPSARAGAANAGIFAAQIIARKDPGLADKLTRFKEDLAAGVEARDRKLQDNLKA